MVRCVMLDRSAMPSGTVNATVSAELLRRYKNTSRELGQEHIEEILQEYPSELQEQPEMGDGGAQTCICGVQEDSPS